MQKQTYKLITQTVKMMCKLNVD